jgi:signal transduction histidine kinase
MKVGYSLRARVLLGAFLWTAGLFAVVGVVTTQVMFHQPNAPRILHRVFAHATFLSALALLFMIAGLFQVRGVLSAVNRLRARLSAVHDGREPRVEGTYPAEVQPLVNDLNTLLDHQEQAVRRAVSRAGDLAHGLKTPLAVLSHEAERAAAARAHRDRCRRHRAGRAHAASGGVPPGARSRCSIRRDAWRALSRR